MGSISARHARMITGHVERILAIEALVAAQALDLRLAATNGPGAGTAARPGAGVAEAEINHVVSIDVLDVGSPRLRQVEGEATCALVHPRHRDPPEQVSGRLVCGQRPWVAGSIGFALAPEE